MLELTPRVLSQAGLQANTRAACSGAARNVLAGNQAAVIEIMVALCVVKAAAANGHTGKA